MHYYSQFGQDAYLDKEIFYGLQGGFFLDIGAYDGVTFSNSYFLEKHRNWNGICVEPKPDVFETLKRNRKCVCVRACLSDKSGEDVFWDISGPAAMLSGLRSSFHPTHVERIHREIRENGGTISEVPVRCITLNDLMQQHGITRINYCSVDTEGNELDILASIDFQRFRFDIISVENNYDNASISRLLRPRGFRLLRRDCDEIYKRIDPYELTWNDRAFPRLTHLIRKLKTRKHPLRPS